jgi:predicted 3-demethylubiquinone-9 3-methyltransferase (glyoxalase superfamily)
MNAPYPMLWFDDRAEEAATFYTSIFPDSGITAIERFSADVPGGRAGSVSTVAFTVGGARFVALNGGPGPEFNDSVSLVVECADQVEIDRYWEALTAGGGEEVMCGWLIDKFGVRWQIIPANIGELLASPAAVQAMLGMGKLDIAALMAAAARR